LVALPLRKEPNHQAIRVQAQQLWIGYSKPIKEFSFVLGVENKQPYLELRPSAGLADNFLPWPSEQADEQGKRLLLSADTTSAMGLLSTTQWRTVRSLLALVPSHIQRLQDIPSNEYPFWIHAAQQLAAIFDTQARNLRYDNADAITVTSPAEGLEIMRLAMRNLEMGSYRNPMLVLDVGVQTKSTRGKTKLTHVHLDFRQWKAGVKPFGTWQPNQQDEHGEYLRISLDIGKNQIDQSAIEPLRVAEKEFLLALVKALPGLCEELNLNRFTLALTRDTWIDALLQAASLAEYELGAVASIEMS
jgi:N-acetylmuramoyl-L-alanine amidase